MHDGVDWKAAPKIAQWWAVDADGKAHWFKAPNVAAFTDFLVYGERASTPVWLLGRLAREPYQEAVSSSYIAPLMPKYCFQLGTSSTWFIDIE